MTELPLPLLLQLLSGAGGGTNSDPTQGDTTSGIGGLTALVETEAGNFFKDPAYEFGGKSFGGGINLDNLGTVLGGLGSLGELFIGGKQLGLANKQYALQKEAFDFNKNAQTVNYNRNLSDLVSGKQAYNGDTFSEADGAKYQQDYGL